MIVRSMYNSLISFNENSGKFVPELAKSWKRINPTTLEFELRDDMIFHTGNPFTSEEVKNTIDYLRDPKVRIRFKGRYAWVKNVEKLGPHKVRIIGIPMPDRQTQLATLFTNGVDVLRNITADNEKSLKGRPGITITASASKAIMYLTLDAAGCSKNKELKDPRVRQAMIMAINRNALVRKLVTGGESAEIPGVICFKTTVACPRDVPNKIYQYDPVAAKKLLAEAGYPNGFSITLNVFAPIKQIGEAIAGDLRKIGIKAGVQPLPLSLYVKKRGRGEFTAFVGYYSTSAQPDLANLMNFFFGANRDYYKDPIIHAAAKKGETEFDLQKRTRGYVPALSRVNEMVYILPISELPIVFAHTDKIRMEQNLLNAGERRISDFFWK